MIRHRHRIVVALLCSSAVLAARASGVIVSSIKQSTSPAVIQPAVSTFVEGELPRLKSATPAVQKAAKEALVSESTGHGDVTATPQYEATYASVLGQKLLPIVQSKAPLRTRLCAAIVATEVAEQTSKAGGPAGLQPLAVALLQDKDDATLLWGIKLSKYVIGDLATQGNKAAVAKLDAMVIAVVKDHPQTGYLAEEAYAALTLEPYRGTTNFASAATMVLPDLLKLMDTRTAQYAQAVPGSPEAEITATVFLAVDGSGPATAPTMRNQVLKALGDAVCAVLNQIANGNNGQELINVAREEGATLRVFGDTFPNKPLSDAGMLIATVGPNTPANMVTASCAKLSDVLKAMGVSLTVPAGGGAAPAGSGTDAGGAQTVADQSVGAK